MQTREHDLSMLSVEQLEERRKLVITGLEDTFHSICTMALRAARIEGQFQKAIILERHFHKLWEELETIIDAIRTHAALAHYSELRSDKLAYLVREGIRLVEPFDWGDDLCTVWLTERDAFVTLASKFLDDDEIVADNAEKETAPPRVVCDCSDASPNRCRSQQSELWLAIGGKFHCCSNE